MGFKGFLVLGGLFGFAMCFFFMFRALIQEKTTYVGNGGFVKTCARYSTEMYRQDELSSVLVEGNEGERCQVLRRSICQE